MRLRQICLVARTLEPTVGDLCAALGIAVAYRDPGVGVFGLENAVMPIGNDFLEVVAPVKENTAAGRYLDRRGGDGGYMVILHGDDAVAERRRITGLGVRAVWEIDRPTYIATHFHPADVAGVLLSVDSVPGADWRTPDADWAPAGPDWRAARRAGIATALVGAEVQHPDPAAAATLWSKILDRPLTRTPKGPALPLEGAEIRFVPAADGRGPGLGGIDVVVQDRAALEQAATARGLAWQDEALIIGGTRVYPVAP